jgi:membrane protease YdiL (CAAX protease family)
MFFSPLIIFYFIKTIAFSNRFYVQTNLEMILLIISTLVIAISEELFFRGIILTLFKKNIHVAIVISTILFGASHFLEGWTTVLSSIPLGLVFAVITIISKSLMPAIIFHFIHNIIVFSTDFTGENHISDGYIAILQQIVILGYAIILWNNSKEQVAKSKVKKPLS